MKNYKLAIVLSAYLFMAFSAPAFAVNEICATNASCCTPPESIIDGGGCPSGTYWIGPANGGTCQTSSVTCSSPSNFSCGTGTCTSISTGSGCPGWQLNLGGGNCVDVLKIIKNSVDPKILNIYNGGLLGSVVYANTSGTVGINTTSPSSSYKLDVNGASRTTSLSTTSLAITGQPSCTYPQNGLQTDAAGNVTCGTISDSDWLRQFSGADNMYAQNAGNVGIGTNNPAAKLEIDGNVAYPAFSVYSNTSSGDQIVFSSVGSGTGDLINIYGGSGANRALYVSGTSVFSGKVGIQTGSPKSAFDVSGGMAIGSYAGNNVAPSNGLIVSGNVGIGINNPSYLLEAKGRVRLDSTFSDTAGIWLSDPYNQNRAFVGLQDNTVNSKVGFYSEASGWGLVLDNSGSVGIGTIEPPYRLTVAPSGDGSGLGIGWNRSANTGETNFYNYGQWGVGGFSFWNYQSPGGSYPTSGASKLLTLSNNGSIATSISTASGDYSSAFGYSSQATNTYSFASGYNAKATGFASSAMGYGTTASGDYSVAVGRNCNNATSNSLAVCNANTDALIASGTDNSWLAARGGNVGIGTQSPVYKLDVADRIRIRGSSSSSTAGLWLADSTPIDRAFIGLLTNGWPPTLGFFNNGDWRMAIDYGGNVGIGTTSPASKLDVNGDIQLTGGEAKFNSGNGLMLSSNNWNSGQNYVDTGWGYVINDRGSYKALMLIGNNSAGGNRKVNIYDDLNVNSSLTAGYIHSTGSGLFSSGLTAFGDTVLVGNVGVSGTLNAWGEINAPYNSWGTQSSAWKSFGNGNWAYCPNGSYVVGLSIDGSGGGAFAVLCAQL